MRRTKIGATVYHAITTAMDARLTGLAAEAAFFSILSLPPLIFGLVGSVGYVSSFFASEAVTDFRDQLLNLSAQVFTADTVSEVIQPTVDEVIHGGRFDIISIGFVIALWSGSRVVNVFVDTVAIVYGFGGERGIVRQRFLSLGAYIIFVVLGVVVIPLVLVGPNLIFSALPARLIWIADLYWPVVLVLATLGLTTIYKAIIPARRRWIEGLPGATIAVIVWIAGSALLRWFLSFSLGASTSIYGPLSAPIAIMLWLYIMSVAILVGAAVNTAHREAETEWEIRQSKY